MTELPLDELRGQVALVTQEHHVFVGTLRDDLALAVDDIASDDRMLAALDAVDALGWVQTLPGGLDTRVGSGGLALSPAQSQQVALARLVLADPHAGARRGNVADRPAVGTPPRAVVGRRAGGRTVIAIAHRLFTAHDADRVAVVEDGQISEIGAHDQLIAADGSYAALWRSWHGEEART